MSYLSKFQREVHEWAQATFPNQTPASKLAHLRDELKELEEDPGDALEIADCFILLLSISEMAGVDLLSAGETKFEINKNRKWGKPDERGVVKHIKES